MSSTVVYIGSTNDGPPAALLSKSAVFTWLVEVLMSDWPECQMSHMEASLSAASTIMELEAAVLTTSHGRSWEINWPEVRFMLMPRLEEAWAFAVVAARKRDNNGQMIYAAKASADWAVRCLDSGASPVERVALQASPVI